MMLDRALPSNNDAERAVLGSVLIDNRAWYRITGVVRADDFFKEQHRILFATIETMRNRGDACDSLTVKAELGDALDSVGGSPYISSLVDGIPDIGNIEQYAEIVARAAKLRRLVTAANEMMTRAILDEEEPEEIAADALAAITNTATNEKAQVRPFGKVIHEAYENAEARRISGKSMALTCGLQEIDSYNLFRPTFGVLGAPSKVGKSALALNVARGFAKHGHPTALFTLESSEEELAWRHAAAESGIGHGIVSDWTLLRDSDMAKLVDVERNAKQIPLYLTRRLRNIQDIYAEARRVKSMLGIQAILIDYIQLIRFPGGPRDREERMAAIAQQLLELAIDQKLNVTVTSQVNKEHMMREDGLLYPSDLKYAAAIGESARFVLMLQRPHVHDPRRAPCEVICHVAAQNEGRTGPCNLHFDEVTQRFADGDCEENNCRRLGIAPTLYG